MLLRNFFVKITNTMVDTAAPMISEIGSQKKMLLTFAIAGIMNTHAK